MAPQHQLRLLGIFGGLALSLAAGSPARALARDVHPGGPTHPSTHAAPVAADDDEEEEREARPGERILDEVVKRLERLAEQARKQGHDELADRIERRIERFKKRADDLRRRLREDRDEPDDRHRQPQGRNRPRIQRPGPPPRGRRPGPEWQPAPPRRRVQPHQPDRHRQPRAGTPRPDDRRPRSEERRFEFRKERPDRGGNRRTPDRRSRARDDDGVELFFGFRMSGRRIELGIAPATRQLRIRIDQHGNEREWRFRFGDNPLGSLRELRRSLSPQQERGNRRPGQRRQTPRRRAQRTSLL